MRSIQYRPEIDGLRALAVLPVILYHMGVVWLPGGFVGVDVFFLISGYLITSIIVKEQQEGRFSFVGFWTRRAKRILPALLTVVFVTLVAGYFVGYRNANSSQWSQALSALFSVANVYMNQAVSDYWGGQTQSVPFIHCWSLSVEEQFYLTYPVLLVWLLRSKKQLVFPIIFLVSLVSLALFIYFSTKLPSATFYLLPFRIWELGAGGLLALSSSALSMHQSRWYSHVLSNFGLILIASSYFLLPNRPLRFKLLIPVVGTILFLGFGQSRKGLVQLLAMPAVNYVGRLSYSLYLWHWPVIVIALQRDPAVTSNLMGLSFLFSLIFLLSAFSYHFIEFPLRRSPKTLKMLPLGLAACLAAIAASKLAISTRGDAYDTSAFNTVAFPIFKYDSNPGPILTFTEQKRFVGVNLGVRPKDAKEAYAHNGVVHRYGKFPPDVLVIGDSYGVMWADAIDDVCRKKGLTVSYFVAAGVSPFMDLPLSGEPKGIRGFTPQQKRLFDMRRLACIKEWKPVVILAALWTFYDMETARDLIEYMGKCGCKVLLVEQPPIISLGRQNSAQYLTYRGYSPAADGQRQIFPQSSQKDVAKGRALVRQLAQRYSFCQLLKTHDYYAADQNNAYAIDGKDILYLDDNHLSTQGAFRLRSRFAQALTSIKQQ